MNSHLRASSPTKRLVVTKQPFNKGINNSYEEDLIMDLIHMRTTGRHGAY